MLTSKLRPAPMRPHETPTRLVDALQPRFGCLTLLHSGAGYGKTTALAATQRADWTWYNLDATDRDPEAFAARLCMALRVEAPPRGAGTTCEVLALDLAHRLQGRSTTVTLDRGEQLVDAVEVGRFLSELLLASPTLALRLAPRTRPALPLERLRLEGRRVEVGPGELRLSPAEIADLLTAAWGRPPEASELEFADAVLCGWPGALQLWQRELAGGGDLTAPLQPGQPLHEYLHEEVLGALPDEALAQVRRDWRWLLGRGPLVKRATNAARRQVADRLVRDRVGVVPGSGGWQLHPLIAMFGGMHTARGGSQLTLDARPARPAGASTAGAPSRLVIWTFGGLRVVVGGVPVPDSAWPTAARRLLELLLSLP